MSKGQESLLGASGSQESALGPNKAEQCPTEDDSTALDAIGRICERYELSIGRQAHQAVSEIGSVIRKRRKRRMTLQSNGGAA